MTCEARDADAAALHRRALEGEPDACRALGEAAERRGDVRTAYGHFLAGSRRDPALEREARRLGDPIAARQRPALEALRGQAVRVATTRRFRDDGRPLEWDRRPLLEVLDDDPPRPAIELLADDLDDALLEVVAALDTLGAVHVRSSRVTDRGARALARLRPWRLFLHERPALTDEGLLALGAIDTLEVFACDGERFTREGLLGLLRARPALDAPIPERFHRPLRQPFGFAHHLLEEWAPGRAELAELARSVTRAFLAAKDAGEEEAALFPLLVRSLGPRGAGAKELMLLGLKVPELLARPDLVESALPTFVEFACAEPDRDDWPRRGREVAGEVLEEWLRRGLPVAPALAARVAERKDVSRVAARVHALLERQGRLGAPVRQALEALASRVERHQGLIQLLERVLDLGDPALAAAAGEAIQAAAASTRPWKTPALVALLARVLAAPPAHGLHEAAAELLGRAASRGGNLACALPALVGALDDGGVAYAAGAALESAVAAGTDLGPVVDALERLVSAPRWTTPLERASGALSRHLAHTGREKPLPPDCSHRRTLAWADEPVPGARAAHRCGVCHAAQLVCIYHHASEDEFVVELSSVWEYRCAACGKFTRVRETCRM